MCNTQLLCMHHDNILCSRISKCMLAMHLDMHFYASKYPIYIATYILNGNYEIVYARKITI